MSRLATNHQKRKNGPRFHAGGSTGAGGGCGACWLVVVFEWLEIRKPWLLGGLF